MCVCVTTCASLSPPRRLLRDRGAYITHVLIMHIMHACRRGKGEGLGRRKPGKLLTNSIRVCSRLDGCFCTFLSVFPRVFPVLGFLPAPSHSWPLLEGRGPLTLHCGLEAGYGDGWAPNWPKVGLPWAGIEPRPLRVACGIADAIAMSHRPRAHV